MLKIKNVEKSEDFINNLAERLFYFAADVLKFLASLANTPEAKTIRYQLSRSAGSSGANYEEAQAGSSKADFINKVRISLREMKESNYWLRLVRASEVTCNYKERDRLIDESRELKAILGAIIQKTRI